MTSFRCFRRKSFDKFPGSVFPFKRTADGELKKRKRTIISGNSPAGLASVISCRRLQPSDRTIAENIG